MKAPLAYVSGEPLPLFATGTPQTLPEALEAAACKSPACGLTIYDGRLESSTATFLSYAALLDGAKRVATGLLSSLTAEESGTQGGHPGSLPGETVLVSPFGPRAAQLLGFWGCLLAGLQPCLIAPSAGQGFQAGPDEDLEQQILALAWQRLGCTAIIVVEEGPSANLTSKFPGLPKDVKRLGLQALLRHPSTGHDRSRAHPVEVAFRIFVASPSSDQSCQYAYSHDSVLANAVADGIACQNLHKVTATASSCRLSWQPLGEPSELLAHCAAVHRGASEVHYASLSGEPRRLLRLIGRHRVGRFDAPAIFFRRALGELRAAAGNVAKSGRKAFSVECVQKWVVAETGSEGLRSGEAEEFLRLSLSPQAELRSVLLSPWGAVIATRCSRSSPALVPVPGVEIRVIETGADSEILQDSVPGLVQVRGLAALPGETADPGSSARPAAPLKLSRGWVLVPGSYASLSFGKLFLEASGPDGQELLKVLGGVEYTPMEVEAVVESAPGVLPGSAMAMMLSGECFSSQKISPALGGLVVAFAPADPAISDAAAAVTAVRGQLAVALGIRPLRVLPLIPCELPRDASGLPCRQALKVALEGLRGDMEILTSTSAQAVALQAMLREEASSEALLPSEWVFEEEFRPSKLSEAPAGEQAAQGDKAAEEAGDAADEDDIEERMEGVARLEIEAEELEETRKLTLASPSPVTLVISDSTTGVGLELHARLREEVGATDAHVWEASAATAVSSVELLAKHCSDAGCEASVVHLVQCDQPASGSEGIEDAARLIELLQAWERSAGKLTQSGSPLRLRLLCVSKGRHIRVAGDLAEPRTSLLLGILLGAAAEWPWLEACQLDAAPSLNASAVAEAALLELRAGFGATSSMEVLLDSEASRLVRRLRPATIELTPASSRRRPPCRAVLLAGGAGGIGALWAQRMQAETVILLGRSPAGAVRPRRALKQLSGGAADVFYLRADLADQRALHEALRGCPAAERIDFAASLCEAFAPPMPFAELPGMEALAGPAAKLRGAENLLLALADLRRPLGRQAKALPVLLASSAVGLLGAARLAPYVAGVRALEALSALKRIQATEKQLDPRCVALSAWDEVGITAAYPVLSKAAPAAGLRVLSARAGVLALEAVFQRFSAPRYGTLAVGLDAAHPRFGALTGGNGSIGGGMPCTTTATMPGCVELVRNAVQKVLGRSAQLGDSFVEVGLDSMSSLSLHSLLCASAGGLQLPTSLFYEQPTVLEVATFVHKQAKEAAGGDAPGAGEDESMEDSLESMLEDDDARRSYNLGLAREALAKGDHEAARHRCQRAADGAAGAALASALSLEAEACERLGCKEDAERAHASAWHSREAQLGPDHPDTSMALARLLIWQTRCQRGIADSDRSNELLRDQVVQARGRFLRRICWPPAADVAHASTRDSAPSGPRLLAIMRLNLDDKLLGCPAAVLDLLPALGALHSLEAFKLRRNGLSAIPEAFGQLLQLRELWLAGNFLTDLPESLGSLPRLQFLSLERNRLPRLPEAVYRLRRLLQLGLDEQDSCLQFLANRPLPVQVLSVLRARGCGAEFPELQVHSGFPTLNTVFWANNGLPAVPSQLVRFDPSLRLLDLAHNNIAELGEELFCLAGLRDLSLAGNRLQKLPSAIGRMRCLQQLWLHGNALEALPEELGELQALAILEVHHNRLASLPASICQLKKLNWLFAHGNLLTDSGLIRILTRLPRLKIAGLGANRLQLGGVDLRGMRASFGLGWNPGLSPEEGVLTEALTTCDLHWDRMSPHEVQDVLVLTFSAQGAPVAQGQTEVRALRDALLKVDALYVCDPANAWFLQDPEFTWQGLPYFQAKISNITAKYRRVFAWGGSMGGSAALLFADLADRVHAFSPQVDLMYTWPTFASESVRERFRQRVQDSVASCRGQVTVHVGEDNHTDNRHAAAISARAEVRLHDTANHNTMKHLKQRGKLLPLLKFEVVSLLIDAASSSEGTL
ncbi:unnamed protein product [Polarella glacialis]|uniref:Carrier domain-containing protein n=1 Tax=Polarella glacialis TaxID=89957 RepID=A0A813FB85_POLGL|nr:unnamed protein product [Polarella glacialis]